MTNLDYLYNPAAAKEILNKNYFVDKKSGFQVIERGMIFPHKNYPVKGWSLGGCGVFDSNGKFINHTYESPSAGLTYPTPPPESIQHSSEKVIYLDSFTPTWGNIISDTIARLWFLKTNDFKEHFKDCRLVYVPNPQFSKADNKNFRRLLEILEVDFDALHAVTQPTQFDKVIVPDKSFVRSKEHRGKIFTKEYIETVDRVRNFALKNRTPTSCKRIYYFHGRRQIGEERLAEYFKSKGYEIIQPEKLTLDEQLNLLINCESFASAIGSCSHNSIFLSDDTEVILIPRIGNVFTIYQETLNQVHPLNVTYVDSTVSIFGTTNSILCFVISEQLKRFFGDKWDGYEEDDFKIFLQYVKNNLKKGNAFNPHVVDYSKSIFQDFMAQLCRREDLILAYDMPPKWKEFRQLLSYRTHVHAKGWGDSWKSENQISNLVDELLNIQAIKVSFPGHKVFYSVYYNDEEGWSEEVAAPEIAGTTGKGKPIYGMRVRLDEAGTMAFDILYRMHKFDGTWTPWAKNGETIYSNGQKLNAVQIKLEPKTDETRA